MNGIELHPEGCTAPQLGRLLEDYLAGVLAPETAAAFEEHYFACAACLEAIRVRQSGAHAFVRGKRSARLAAWGAATLALVLVACATLFGVCRGSFLRLGDSGSVSSLAELSRLTPPRYVPSTTAMAETESRQRFVEAMRAYTAGDYARAIGGLEAAKQADPSHSEPGFYLGVSYLATNRVDRAIQTFGATIALGDTSYLERCRFYLAKAYLRREAIDDARKELRAIVAAGGSLSREAERLLRDVDRVTNSRAERP